MLTVIAYIIIIVGLILFPLPVPVGIFFIIGGVAMLISVNPTAQTQIAKLRKKHPKVDEVMHKATKKSPRFLRHILHKTRHRNS